MMNNKLMKNIKSVFYESLNILSKEKEPNLKTALIGEELFLPKVFFLNSIGNQVLFNLLAHSIALEAKPYSNDKNDLDKDELKYLSEKFDFKIEQNEKYPLIFNSTLQELNPLYKKY